MTASPFHPEPAFVEFDLDGLAALHPNIDTAIWCAPLLRCLLPSDAFGAGPRAISIECRSVELHERHSLHLHWPDMSQALHTCLRTHQPPRITEFGALGLAAIAVTAFLRKEMTEVAMVGSGFDYWIGDRELALEVSGTRAGALDSLLTIKTAQLFAPGEVDRGLVFVVAFHQFRSYFWFGHDNEAE